ncbi:MAG: TPM domain-containing protein [Solobacterium sp.]|nr:TPM domain-containing protein [Solobacterium sp.]
MLKTIKKILLCVFLLFAFRIIINAGGTVYGNPENGHRVVIDDQAGLLSEDEEKELMEHMIPLTAYGEVAFAAIDKNYPKRSARYIDYPDELYYYSSLEIARNYYTFCFGEKSGILFMIDLASDQTYRVNEFTKDLIIIKQGAIHKKISDYYADKTIDKVAQLYSRKEYLKCAASVFDRIGRELAGEKNDDSAKILSSILLAVSFSVLLNYLLVLFTRRWKPQKRDRMIC